MEKQAVDRIVEAYVSDRANIDETRKKSASFLKKFRDDFNSYLNNNGQAKINIANPVFRPGKDFPLFFDLVLTMGPEGRKEDFILACTASEFPDNAFRINDGHGQHFFYMDGKNQEANLNTFSKLADNFIRKFGEHKDLNIDL